MSPEKRWPRCSNPNHTSERNATAGAAARAHTKSIPDSGESFETTDGMLAIDDIYQHPTGRSDRIQTGTKQCWQRLLVANRSDFHRRADGHPSFPARKTGTRKGKNDTREKPSR
ncbi:aminomethyltransferase [Anopheles sinensis]|uniref:Aminomethyltransferase n=1 Tax=Anopheles sinensis TaxID=74873 RepID=A0A084WCV2_ANOSI|nr:aminomethyltransferase [Anopheles sinensis]